jgi:hypothetical protein
VPEGSGMSAILCKRGDRNGDGALCLSIGRVKKCKFRLTRFFSVTAN